MLLEKTYGKDCMCVVVGCSNSGDRDKNFHFYTFPKKNEEQEEPKYQKSSGSIQMEVRGPRFPLPIWGCPEERWPSKSSFITLNFPHFARKSTEQDQVRLRESASTSRALTSWLRLGGQVTT